MLVMACTVRGAPGVVVECGALMLGRLAHRATTAVSSSLQHAYPYEAAVVGGLVKRPRMTVAGVVTTCR